MPPPQQHKCKLLAQLHFGIVYITIMPINNQPPFKVNVNDHYVMSGRSAPIISSILSYYDFDSDANTYSNTYTLDLLAFLDVPAEGDIVFKSTENTPVHELTEGDIHAEGGYFTSTGRSMYNG